MTPLTLSQAQAIIEGAVALAADRGFKPLCIVVLDEGGHVRATARQDGATFGRVEVANAKAFGAVSIGPNSRQLEQMALDRPHFMAGVIGAIGGAVVPVAGGVVILDADGSRIGAVGVSGDTSDNDEAAAIAGIEAAGLTAAS
ncbi:MAG: heme-binding protein [Actinomycetota bacterium]|nr:heme-binding protein [Actinomycetota bacterium]